MTEVGTPIWSTWWLEGTRMWLWNVYVTQVTCIHPWASCYANPKMIISEGHTLALCWVVGGNTVAQKEL